MYKLVFYESFNGESPVYDFISQLDASNTSSDLSVLKQIKFRFGILEHLGTRAPQEYVEHIRGNVWQIRVGRKRVLFFYWKNNSFVLLHYFTKKTQKTPKREIAQAEREIIDWLERN